MSRRDKSEHHTTTWAPAPESTIGLADRVSTALLESYRQAPAEIQHVNSYELPSLEVVRSIIDQLRALLFPGFVGESLLYASPGETQGFVRARVIDVVSLLRIQLYRGLHRGAGEHETIDNMTCSTCRQKSCEIADRFMMSLASLRYQLATDVNAFFEADPAASGTDEIIFCYPGYYAITVYRLAHELHDLGAKLIPRMMTELAHERVGIDIHPGAKIGESFFIDHGTGVVIGATAEIGRNAKIYQGVTLGALTVKDRSQCGKRHPTLRDDVTVYAGATILGGETIIGRGAIIGGNAWVTASVAAGTILTQTGLRGRTRVTFDPDP